MFDLPRLLGAIRQKHTQHCTMIAHAEHANNEDETTLKRKSVAASYSWSTLSHYAAFSGNPGKKYGLV